MDYWTVIYMPAFLAAGGVLYRYEQQGLDRLPAYFGRSRTALYSNEGRQLIGRPLARKMRACQWAGVTYFVGLILSFEHNLWVDALMFLASLLLTARLVWVLI